MADTAYLEQLFLLFEKHQPERERLSPNLKTFLTETVRERTYRKNHVLLYQDDVPKQAWFIVRGVARVYFYDQHAEREITSWFWYQGEMIWPFNSLFRQKESVESIELLEESTLLLLSAVDIKTMTRRFPDYRFSEKSLIEEYQDRISCHRFENIFMPGRKKLNKLIETHREIFTQAYLKDIASFLNMHPSALSRLRGK